MTTIVKHLDRGPSAELLFASDRSWDSCGNAWISMIVFYLGCPINSTIGFSLVASYPLSSWGSRKKHILSHGTTFVARSTCCSIQLDDRKSCDRAKVAVQLTMILKG